MQSQNPPPSDLGRIPFLSSHFPRESFLLFLSHILDRSEKTSWGTFALYNFRVSKRSTCHEQVWGRKGDGEVVGVI